MKSVKSLRRLLQRWQVAPKTDPAFQVKVWKRIKKASTQKRQERIR